MRLPRPSRPSFSSDDGVTYRGAYGASAPVLPCITLGATNAASGGAVAQLRSRLHAKGYLAAKDVTLADFDFLLMNDVVRFQRAMGLTDDGIVGQKTWAKLDLKGGPCAKTIGTGQTVGTQTGSGSGASSGGAAAPSGGGAGTAASLPAKKMTEQPWFWPAVVGTSALAIFGAVYGVRRYQASKPSVRRNFAKANKAKSAGLIAQFKKLGNR